eukprot:PhM_4_TR13288/c1_g2_i2/m.36249
MSIATPLPQIHSLPTTTQEASAPVTTMTPHDFEPTPLWGTRREHVVESLGTCTPTPPISIHSPSRHGDGSPMIVHDDDDDDDVNNTIIACPKTPRRFDVPPAVSPDAAAWIYAMLVAVDRSLTKHKVRYYAEGGTLLGLARDGGIIAHDDDGDLQIHPDDTERFLAAVPSIEREVCTLWARDELGVKMVLRPATFGYKLMLVPSNADDAWELWFDTLGGEWAPGFAIVDFFLVDVSSPSGACRYRDAVMQRMVEQRGNGDILYDRLGSLPHYTFGPIQLRAPEHLIEATKDQFGPKCFERIETKSGGNQIHRHKTVVDYNQDLFKKLLPRKNF